MPAFPSTKTIPYTPYAFPTPQVPEYKGVMDTLHAAFQQNSETVNAYNLLARQQFPPDSNFNLADAAAKSPYFLDNMKAFSRVASQDEFNATEARIRQTYKDQETLAGAGFWGSLAAGAVTQLIDPTILIPLAGELRGAKGVAQSFALASAAATAHEGILWFAQDNRPTNGMVLNIAAGTVLGGILGSAAKYMHPQTFKRVSGEMAGSVYGYDLPTPNFAKMKEGEAFKLLDMHGEPVEMKYKGFGEEFISPDGKTHSDIKNSPYTIPKQAIEPQLELRFPGGEGGSLSAKDARARGPIKFRKMDKAMTAISKTAGPIQYIMAATRKDLDPHSETFGKQISVSEDAKLFANQLGNPGMGLDNTELNMPVVDGGSVEARRNIHERAMVKLVQIVDKQYGIHILGSEKKFGKTARAKFLNFIHKLPDKKLTMEQFHEAVIDAVHMGTHNIPEVEKSAQALRNFYKYFQDVADRYHKYRQDLDGKDVKRPFNLHVGETLPSGEQAGYFNYVYDPTEALREDFVSLLTKTFLHHMQSTFVKDLEKFTKSVKKFKEQLAAKGIKNTDAYKQYLKQLKKEERAIKKIISEKNKSASDEKLVQDELASNLQEQEWTKAAASGKNYQISHALTLRDKLYEALEEWTGTAISRKGGVDVHVLNGEADFSEAARDAALHVAHKIRGDEVRVHGMDMLNSERGSFLARMLNIPYEEVKSFLIKDPEHLARVYLRTMGADLEMFRMFGSVNAASQFLKLREAFDNQISALSRTGKRSASAVERIKAAAKGNFEHIQNEFGDNAKEVLKLQHQHVEIWRKLHVLIDRLRHERGHPENPHSILYRMGRSIMDSNVFSKMGMVAVSSYSDLARPMMKFGLLKTFRDSWAPLATNLSELNWTKEHARMLGIATDVTTHNRTNAIFHVSTITPRNTSKVERVMHTLANKTGLVALFDQWTAHMKYISLRVYAAEISRGIRLGAKSELPPMYKDMFFDAGLSPQMQKRIWEEMQKPEGSHEYGGNYFPNTQNWTDLDAADAYAAALQKLVELDNITTPGINLSEWMDKNIGFKMLAQFRSFSSDTTTKVLLSGIQDIKSLDRRSMAAVEGSLFMLALGAISYYTSAAAIGGKRWEEAKNISLGNLADEAIDRSGLLGWFTEVSRMTKTIPEFDYLHFGERTLTRRRPDGVLDALLGPSYGLMHKLSKILVSIDNPTKSTIHTIASMLPYNNVVYFRRLLSHIEDAVTNQVLGNGETK